MSARVGVDRPTGGAVRPAFELVLPPAPVAIAGLIAAMLFACAALLATTQLGSGDYGQWLMTARPYAGLDIPAYRADAAVPPVVPFLLGAILWVVGDPATTLHVGAVLLLLAMGVSVYLATASLFDPLAGLLAVVATMLVSNLFLQLFAFGGLLQAGSIALIWLSIAALWRARCQPEHAQRWLLLGAGCIGLGGLTHTGTASISVPTGIVVAGLVVLALTAPWRDRLVRMAPIGVVVAALAVYWLLFLLPGATDLARNPASLDYRGPNRLFEGLTGAWPNLVIIAGGAIAMLVGGRRELAARRIGPWVVVLAWMGATLAVLVAALLSGASTDYPRFVTPIMAPLVVAGAAGAAFMLEAGGDAIVRAMRRGSSMGLAVLGAGLLLAIATPGAVGGFAQDAHGYEVPDPTGLRGASGWIRDNLTEDQVVLANAREGKWIEGMSGRGALFSNAVRYSFRPDEWQRSLAADTLLRSTGGALANEFFVARLTDAGAQDASPRGIAIAPNHGGEFVDLLASVPSGTAIIGLGGERLATLSNLQLSSTTVGLQGDDAVSNTVWSGARRGGTVELHQTVDLRRSSSTLEITLVVPDSVPAQALEMTLGTGGSTPLDRAELRGSEANLWYRPLGSAAPHLRVVVSGVSAGIVEQPNGRLVARANGQTLKVLVTDLTAADFPSVGLQALNPTQLLDRYAVKAALLQRDPTLAARRRRLEALGFRVAQTSGAYEILVRDTGPGGAP